MQSWDAVRLQMFALGCSRVLTIELACPTCGTWRGELPEEQDCYPCPVCTLAAKVCHIIEGYTRRVLVTEWRQIAKPLSDKARTWIASVFFLEDRSHLKDGRELRRKNSLYRGQTVATAR
jgi:hypothetical protein